MSRGSSGRAVDTQEKDTRFESQYGARQFFCVHSTLLRVVGSQFGLLRYDKNEEEEEDTEEENQEEEEKDEKNKEVQEEKIYQKKLL
ncbi:hypothetical protein PoB_004132400 [Plakobranchus ocellatus]|uniref:Uncharacterized protein n=1 Tax=Plakobranchus ocellatus TaxID=259542 RepID=A0AAV4B8Z7_9GAST|nr:hypothetical protein PoB_004132400 [Plakobranchus ocellatus]